MTLHPINSLEGTFGFILPYTQGHNIPSRPGFDTPQTVPFGISAYRSSAPLSPPDCHLYKKNLVDFPIGESGNFQLVMDSFNRYGISHSFVCLLLKAWLVDVVNMVPTKNVKYFVPLSVDTQASLIDSVFRGVRPLNDLVAVSPFASFFLTFFDFFLTFFFF